MIIILPAPLARVDEKIAQMSKVRVLYWKISQWATGLGRVLYVDFGYILCYCFRHKFPTDILSYNPHEEKTTLKFLTSIAFMLTLFGGAAFAQVSFSSGQTLSLGTTSSRSTLPSLPETAYHAAEFHLRVAHSVLSDHQYALRVAMAERADFDHLSCDRDSPKLRQAKAILQAFTTSKTSLSKDEYAATEADLQSNVSGLINLADRICERLNKLDSAISTAEKQLKDIEQTYFAAVSALHDAIQDQ